MHPDNDDSTPQSRELGILLRGLRKRADYQAREVAKGIGWTPVKVSRVETGKQRITDVEVAIYAMYCGASGKEMEELLDMAREVHNGYRVKPLGELMPDELRSLIIEETSAVHLTEFEPIFIPGLAQTEDYARALIKEGRPLVKNEIIEGWVQARTGRQALIKRINPPQCYFLVHERALRTLIGNPKIMNEQMLHLLFLGGRPQCDIRVVPASSGGTGLITHPLRVMRYADHAPIVYLESWTASFFFHDRKDVDAYQSVVNRIDSVALDEADSREAIVRIASEFEVMGDGDDGQAGPGHELA
jgi:transcriptional regulator with XRE-family HTH domain